MNYIINETTDNFVCRYDKSNGIIGLMFKKQISDGYGLLIKFPNTKKPSIHTLFCRFTMDLYFIDKDKKVVDIKNIKPWSFYTSAVKAQWVLEMNENGVLSEVCIGDELSGWC